MRAVPRSRVDEEEANFFQASSRRMDCSIRLIKAVSTIVIFVAGAALGLSLSAHFTHYFSSNTELFFTARDFTPNCGKVCLSMENFVTPPYLMHDMTDDELFWRASLVPVMKEYPFERVPKVAFMFMTRAGMPFLPLWERFFKGHDGLYSVYVHMLPGYKMNVSDTSVFYNRQIPSKKIAWGSISMVDAEKRLLANALLDFSNERFVLLSESCIPVFNFPMVYKYLVRSAYSFVSSYGEESPHGHGRYNVHMYPAIEPYQWRKGSQWFELSRELAVDIVADNKYYDIFRKQCRTSCYPDKHFIPTYLNMFHAALNGNRSVTWVDWSSEGLHPATYDHENITEGFIQSIRDNKRRCTYNSKQTGICFLFAMKFAPNALEPLLNLTSRVMGF